MIKIRRRLFGFCRTGRRHASQLPPAESSRRVARHESSFSPDYGPAFERAAAGGLQGRKTRLAASHRPPSPECDMQALMEARPFEEPEDSKAAALLVKDRIARAIDSLEPREKWIFEAHHYRGLSFRQIAAELSVSKTTADRVYRVAKANLRSSLGDFSPR